MALRLVKIVFSIEKIKIFKLGFKMGFAPLEITTKEIIVGF